MKMRNLVLCTVMTLAFAGESWADVLSTITTGGNSQSGNMFNIQDTGSNGIIITGFAQNFVSATTNSGYTLYYRIGGVGDVLNTASSWTQAATATTFTSNAQGTLTLIPFSNSLAIKLQSGQTLGIYLVNSGGSNVSYTNGTALNAVAAADTNLTIYQGYGVAGLFGSGFSPRIWNGSIFYSLAGPSQADTQLSLAQSAMALRNAYALQSISMNNNLNLDCTLFDAHGICASVSGTRTNLTSTDSNSASGILTVAYRINNKFRVGAYLDQTASINTAAGVHLNNSSPAFGAFGVWNANANGLGTQIRVAAGYADRDITVTRQIFGSSEAGTGNSNLISQGASIVGSYAMEMPGDFVFSPYAGVRYTKFSSDGYTEDASSSVTSPLSYSSLTQNTTTAIAGAKWTKHTSDKVVISADLGLEQDLNNNSATYTATSVNISGLVPIALNPNINRTRPAASIGGYYNINSKQRIGASMAWSEQAFSSNNATSLMVTYTAGF